MPAGIKFKHNLGDVEMTNIVEATGPGCCIFDYDNDGSMGHLLRERSMAPRNISETAGVRSRAASRTHSTIITTTELHRGDRQAGVGG